MVSVSGFRQEPRQDAPQEADAAGELNKEEAAALQCALTRQLGEAPYVLSLLQKMRKLLLKFAVLRCHAWRQYSPQRQ